MKISAPFLFLLLIPFVGFAQKKGKELDYLTSETKYVDAYEFKTKVITLGLSVQSDVSDDDSPSAFILNGGYEFRKLYDEYNLYWGIGPRLRVGWMTGDWSVYTQNQDYDLSLNSFVWGLSVTPSIGLILDDEYNISAYLEGELGILNLHSQTKLRPAVDGFGAKNDNNYLKLHSAIRAGLRGRVSSKLEASVWVGLSNLNTNDALSHVRYDGRRFEKFPLFGEVGLGIGF